MKIKQFTAPQITQAMEQIRAELGEEAIIVSTEEFAGGVRITAAIENKENIDFTAGEQLSISPARQVYDDVKIRESLEYHDVLPDISSRILAISRYLYTQNQQMDNQQLLAAVLEQMYGFQKILTGNCKNKVFVGIPGCGKSTAIAKVAARAKVKNIKTCIISTDNVRAGANGQLEAFAKIMQTDFYFCKTARDLFNTVQDGQEKYAMLLIDTPGINPYIDAEVVQLEEMTDSLKAEKILVADAGRNTLEMVETAEIFKRLGVELILPTHMDMTRRIGGVLSAAYDNHLTFYGGSVSSDIARGVADMTPQALARLILTE